MRYLLNEFIQERKPEYFVSNETINESEAVVKIVSVFGEVEGDVLMW
jgi:CheY-specific phosphatase CheX